MSKDFVWKRKKNKVWFGAKLLEIIVEKLALSVYWFFRLLVPLIVGFFTGEQVREPLLSNLS